MFGIDTNVLLRFFNPDDDPMQTEAARRFVRDKAPIHVNVIVVAEFAWTLRRRYGFDRNEAARFFTRLVSAPEFKLDHERAVVQALQLYKQGPADFADYLIGELDTVAGCRSTITFDVDAAKASTFQLLRT